MLPGCGTAAQLCQMSGALVCCTTVSGECSVCGSGATSRTVDPPLLSPLQQKDALIPCQNIIHRADVLLWMSCAWRAGLCHSSLTQPFLFSHVGRSSWDLLHFPGQKAKQQDEVQPAPSSLRCLCSPLLQREEGPPSRGRGCSGVSSFPAVPPCCPWGLPPTFFSPRLRLPGEVWVWFHPGKTLHSWGQSGACLPQPSAQSRVAGAAGVLLSPWICAILTFLPPSSFLRPAGRTLPVSKFKDADVASCVL